MTATAVANILSGDQKLLEDRLAQHPQADQLRRLLGRSLFNKLFFPAKQLSRLDARFTPALETLQQHFEALCLVDLHFFSSTTHPLRKLFDTLIKLGGTWYSRDAKASQIFFDKISELIEAANEWTRDSTQQVTDKSNNTKLLKTLAEFIHWANAELKRAELLEERLCAAELNQLTLMAAENYAAESINNAFNQVYLPTDLSMRLNSHLKNCLQHAFLQESQTQRSHLGSPFLRKWRQLFPLLRNIFLAHQNPSAQQDLYRDIPVAINELELSIPLAAGAQDTYTEFVSLITHRLMQIVQHQPLDTFPFSPLVYSQELSFSQPNSFVQKNIDALKTGQWFLVMGTQNDWIRCKLALINTAASCLLFVDNSGRKVMLKSFADFSSLAALGDVRPLTEVSIEKAITDTLVQLLTKMNSLSSEFEETEVNELQRTHKQAAEKALAEAAALEASAAKKIKPPLEPSTEPNAAIDSEPLSVDTSYNEIISTRTSSSLTSTSNSLASISTSPPSIQEQSDTVHSEENIPIEACKEQMKTLGLGAWVEIIQAPKPVQRLKLAVVIAAAGKYIFVDELGRKQGEFLQEQLIDLMHHHQFKIISHGEKFEDQLVKVIRGLRKDIS